MIYTKRTGGLLITHQSPSVTNKNFLLFINVTEPSFIHDTFLKITAKYKAL